MMVLSIFYYRVLPLFAMHQYEEEWVTIGHDEFRRVIDSMRSFPAEWFVIGGWSIDLYVGAVTRDHADIEISIWRDDQTLISQHFPAHSLSMAVETPHGGEWVPWDGAWIDPPVHQIRLQRVGEPEFELFLNPHDAEDWLFRRDHTIRMPLERAVRRTDDGIPYLTAEAMLLFKGRCRPKDEADFEHTLPRLDSAQRDWLARSIEPHYGTDHPWLARLRE